MNSDYDFNVWSDGDGVLRVSAYRMTVDSMGIYGTDTSNSIMLEIPMTVENHDVVAYLLDMEEWDSDGNLFEYDEWEYPDYMTVGDVPEMLSAWLETLPPYKMETV